MFWEDHVEQCIPHITANIKHRYYLLVNRSRAVKLPILLAAPSRDQLPPGNQPVASLVGVWRRSGCLIFACVSFVFLDYCQIIIIILIVRTIVMSCEMIEGVDWMKPMTWCMRHDPSHMVCGTWHREHNTYASWHREPCAWRSVHVTCTLHHTCASYLYFAHHMWQMVHVTRYVAFHTGNILNEAC